MFVEAFSGLTAGLLSTLTVHPLDLIKTRLQINRAVGTNKFGTSFRLLQQIARTEGNGYMSLYRGLAVNVTGNMLSWSIFFLLYGELKNRTTDRNGNGKLSDFDILATSGCAGVLTAICTNPLWVVKTRMLSTAATTVGAYPTMLSGFRSILRTDGPRGLLRGLVPALFGVTHGSFQFMFYERSKDWRLAGKPPGERLGSGDYLVLSAGAKIAAGIITYPYKVVQTRIQSHQSDYKGPMDVCKKLWRGEGVRGFYKGLAPNIARVLPSTCITFLVYENTRAYLG
ncbi:mitochondrial carrier [Wilcoxina mikolae CBS 423.85]|nr:mitochondrial carrier [Wilcoxina mikolae CBS 423.85]